MSIAVLGAGSWGTALARMLARKGLPVNLWVYEEELAPIINDTHVNSWYLDGYEIPDNLTASNDIATVLKDATMVVSVTPSHAVRPVWGQCAGLIPPNVPIVCCSKGIETGTGKLMSDILPECFPEHPTHLFTYLSGPSFAKEVAEEHPTAVVIAGVNDEVVAQVQHTFRTPFFMTFTNHDVRGVETGGALKNVLAIGTGIVEGLGFGHNTRAALITRGLYEMIKLGRTLGADAITFAGLAGMGDLVLTCTGGLSRNRQVGLALGEGKTLQEILDQMNMVAEGIKTAKAVHELMLKHKINAPICHAVYQIIYENKPPAEAVKELSSMELNEELGAIQEKQLLQPEG